MITKVYTRYPISSILIYNGTTILHFLLGGFGIMLGYNFSRINQPFGFLYLVFAFIQMYVIMPLVVCNNCFYYEIKDSVCISGLNVISKKIAKPGNPKNLVNRSKGIFSHNKLYMASLFIPIIAMIPALFLNFSFLLLAIYFIVVGLLLYRFFIVFPKVGCVHCIAKQKCPNAIAMGLAKK